MSCLRSAAAMVLVLMGTAMLALPAEAFICSRVAPPPLVEVPCSGQSDFLGASLSWDERQIPFTLDSAGTDRLPGSDELDVLRQSFAPWSNASNGSDTTDLSFFETPLNGAAPEVGFDVTIGAPNANYFVFYDDAWPRPGQASSVVALTTTSFDPASGRIYDADVEFNSANFVFEDLPSCCPGGCPLQCTGRTDLTNTAVHEIGHFLGLSHADDMDIDAANPAIADATMFSGSGAGETKKRDLAADDIAGVLFKYPAGEPNGYCTAGEACGCCAPPFSPTGPTVGASGCSEFNVFSATPAMIVLVCLGIVGRRRSRPRRRGGRE